MNFYDVDILIIDFWADEEIMITDAIKEALEYANPDYKFYDTLEFKCDAFVSNIYVVNNIKSIEYDTNIYIPVNFGFSLPEQSPNVKGEFNIDINAMSLEIRTLLRSVSNSSNTLFIKYVQFIERIGSPLEAVAYDCWFESFSVKENNNGLTITASPPDITQQKFPNRMMTVDNIPGAIV